MLAIQAVVVSLPAEIMTITERSTSASSWRSGCARKAEVRSDRGCSRRSRSTAERISSKRFPPGRGRPSPESRAARARSSSRPSVCSRPNRPPMASSGTTRAYSDTRSAVPRPEKASRSPAHTASTERRIRRWSAPATASTRGRRSRWCSVPSWPMTLSRCAIIGSSAESGRTTPSLRSRQWRASREKVFSCRVTVSTSR
ncbi:hypothetical protein BEN35_05490 [Streptomyces fradiae]|nr:hypothetical protein BEN35_05490 [Streptomyces fradiae]